MLTLRIPPARVARRLVLIVAGLTIAHLLALWSTVRCGRQHGEFIINLVDMDAEHNLPTLFSFSCLLACSLLLALIGWASRRQSRGASYYWQLLAAAFCLLAADEALMLHEQISGPIRRWLQVDGILHFAWVIPYGIVLLVLGVLGLGFIRRLPSRSRLLFGAAAVIYVGGALGMELLSGKMGAIQPRPLSYEWLTSVEELMELSGLVLFIYALLDHIEKELPGTHLIVTSATAPLTTISAADPTEPKPGERS